MDPSVVVGHVAVGAAVGTVGQLVRVVVGLKKELDQAGGSGKTPGDRFDGRQLLVSLLLGALAGAIAGAMWQLANAGQALTGESVLLLIGAGYAGIDFIEGMATREAPPAAITAPGVAPAPAPPGR